MSNEKNGQSEKILQLVLNAIQQDKDLRDKFQVGDKFRFIRDRLTALQVRVEDAINTLKTKVEKKKEIIAEDEVVVYVYIYNAQGLAFQTWQKMISPSVFYEYSVNRPIYNEKSFVESFIRSRPNKVQHGYIAVAIKKQDVLLVPEAETAKDTIGNPLIKIREGSLQFNRFIVFMHNNNEYIFNENGQLVKKQE